MIPTFNIINPKINKQMPFFQKEKGIFYIPIKNKKKYKYFLECSAPDECGNNYYYILLGETRFDFNCRTCHIDNYFRCQIRPKGEIKDFIERECSERGNIDATLIDSTTNYDVYKLV